MSMNEAAPPDISVAVVSYNTRDLLRACLCSLTARETDGEARLEIIVADNGSTDGSAAMVRAEFPAVRVIETGENLGFGRANNLALSNASGLAYCLVNSDAEVLPGGAHAVARRPELRPEDWPRRRPAFVARRPPANVLRRRPDALGGAARADLYRRNSPCAPSCALFRSDKRRRPNLRCVYADPA